MELFSVKSSSSSDEGIGFERRVDDRPVLLCFSHLRWDFVWQRPQHLLVRAARRYRVIFLEEPIFAPVVAPKLSLRGANGLTVATPVLPTQSTEIGAVEVQRRLVDDFVGRKTLDVIWYYTPMAIPFTRHLSAGTIVYDNMDELSAFRGASTEMLANEDELFARADLVFTGGASLFAAKRARHPAVHAFPSSIDAKHFHMARKRKDSEPTDQAPIARPRLGFFGVIDERFDLDLLGKMAAFRPDWQFVMIGPVVKIDPATLPQGQNIHWLGQKSYSDLPAYLAGWDVGLMPFAMNESTRFISPTKTPEFLAAGVPVVSTPIADVVRPYGEMDLVEIASCAEDFVKKAERLLEGVRPDWLRRVDQLLATGSWDRTWADMHRLLSATRSQNRPTFHDPVAPPAALSLATAG